MKVNEIVLLPVVMAVLAVVAVKANADGASSALSDVTGLNTQSYTAAVPALEEDLDTRTYTQDVSPAKKLNTKKIIGTIMLMR